MRILLVEDDKELCDAIKLQLERAGYETDCCGQGHEAGDCRCARSRNHRAR